MARRLKRQAAVNGTIVIAAALFFVAKQRNVPVVPTITIDGKTWTVEYADTAAVQEKGLGDRDALCKTCGMLFRFDAPGAYGFWMKGMRFPLDIAWMRDGKVIFLAKDIPADSKDIFTPTSPADAVLEVNAGDLVGVAVSDAVIVRE